MSPPPWHVNTKTSPQNNSHKFATLTYPPNSIPNLVGFQEPGDGTAIAEFADKKSFDGVILSKSDVNGPDTRPLFAYLKAATGKAHIDWNFDGMKKNCCL